MIRDNGIGFDVNKNLSGNGIKNMRKRADEINAELKIESTTGGGTGIELTLKI
jgi:signal transduction histidine kinase